jgi:hypothetical protein
LSGLPGSSDRPGRQRLYFNRALDYFAEFLVEDVVHTEPIPAEQPPLVGLETTRVTLRRNAAIDYTRTRYARPLDEFDLDIRLSRGERPRQREEPRFTEPACPETEDACVTEDCDTLVTCRCGDTVQITVCRGRNCPEDLTDRTCRTDCGQPTCETCQTRCGQPTCTCWTQCEQRTCAPTCTCQTQCQQTCGCHTEVDTRCDTCNPRICGR